MAVLVPGDDVDPREDVLPVAAQVRKHDGGLGKPLGQVLHFLGVGVDLHHVVEPGGELHHLRPLGRVVLVAGHVVAELAQPDEAVLLAAVLDLAQRLVDAEGRDHATAAEAPPVLVHVLGHLAVAVAVVLRRLRLVAPRGGDDAAAHAALFQVGDELVHVPRDQVPLEVLAVVAGDVQVRVVDAAARLDDRFAAQRLAADKLGQADHSGREHLSTMIVRHRRGYSTAGAPPLRPASVKLEEAK